MRKPGSVPDRHVLKWDAPAILMALFIAIASRSGLAATPKMETWERPRLLLKNEFSSPEKVVKYFVARDGAGFYWYGMDPAERRAFTTWTVPPRAESFLVARSAIVGSTQFFGQDVANVEVEYEVAGMADGSGVQQEPPGDARQKVVFTLRKLGAQWKIEKSAPSDVIPTILVKKPRR